MDDLKIEKETRPVVLELSDGREIAGEVFLSLYEAHHTGIQKLGDLLNGEKPFIPIKTIDGMFLLNRRQVVLGKTKSKWEKDDLMTLGKRYAVCVKMTRGGALEGEIFVNLSEGASRVKDYFNQSLRFLPLIQPEWVVYINCEFVLSVRD